MHDRVCGLSPAEPRFGRQSKVHRDWSRERCVRLRCKRIPRKATGFELVDEIAKL